MSGDHAKKPRARSRQANDERPRLRSWASAALGAFVLVSSGFLLGVAVGVVSEEPDIVASHLMGQSDEVSFDVGEPRWGSAQPDAISPSPPARPQPVADTGSPTQRAVSAAPPEAESPLRVTPPSGSRGSLSTSPEPVGWAIQVGAFSRSSTANALTKSLEAKGFRAYLKPSAGSSGSRWRVRVGPFATQQEAQELARRLEGEEMLSTWVITEEGR